MTDPAADADAVTRHLTGLAATAQRSAADLAGAVAAVARLAGDALERGGKLFFCGNGGSAADAQHLATEYVVRFQRQRRALPAIALTTDTSLLTAAANDLGFEAVFARQVEALGAAGDVLFLHTTSGESPNLLAAADAARARGVTTVGMLARGGGSLRDRVDHAIVIPTDNGAHAQELQLALGHAICALIEARLAGPGATRNQGAMTTETTEMLHAARAAEKQQALYYRALAAAAEDRDDTDLSERLNGLHADEQHHLSRLTVRLVELNESVEALDDERAPDVQLDGWEADARQREHDEVARYERLLGQELDGKTRALLEQFVVVERSHAKALGGKWMGAEP
jgi:phosphoheptose isomerase/rubrerythrin